MTVVQNTRYFQIRKRSSIVGWLSMAFYKVKQSNDATNFQNPNRPEKYRSSACEDSETLYYMAFGAQWLVCIN